MSNLKMSNWFKLPVDCSHITGDTEAECSSDSIAIDGCVVLTGHHVEKVEIAINSYDSNQELIATLKKEAELAKERANKARKEERNKWMPICNKLQADNELLREALTEMVKGYCDLVDSGDAGFWDPEKDDEVIKSRAALAATAKG